VIERLLKVVFCFYICRSDDRVCPTNRDTFIEWGGIQDCILPKVYEMSGTSQVRYFPQFTANETTVCRLEVSDFLLR
jgi:hypothetical protein